MRLPDAPDIRRTEATGWPRRAEWPRCPVCGAECETLYRGLDGEVLGCEDCVTASEAWEEET